MSGPAFDPPRPDDDPAILALMGERYREYAFGPEVLAASLDFFRSLPGVDPARHQLVARDDGQIVGAVIAWPEEGLHRITGFGYVHPDARGRGIGSAFLDWFETLALTEGARIASNDAPAADQVWRAMLAGRGFTEARLFYTMVHDHPAGIEVAPFPEGVRIRNDLRGVELLDTLVDAHDRSFAEHWDYQPGRYRNMMGPWIARDDFDPGLVTFAEDASGTLLGYSVGLYADGTGDVDELGVLPHARGRGLGRALLHHCVGQLAVRGATRVTLGVDAQNATGALGLYERAGFRELSSGVVAHKWFTA